MSNTPSKSDVFRFMSVRPAQTINTAQSDRFIKYTDTGVAVLYPELKTIKENSALSTEQKYDAITAKVNTFFNNKTTGIFADYDSLNKTGAFPGFEAIDEYLQAYKDDLTVTDLRDFIGEIESTTVSGLFEHYTHADRKSRIWDNLFAITIRGDEFGLKENIISIIKIINLFEKLNAQSITNETIPDVIDAQIVLPKTIFPVEIPAVEEAETEPPVDPLASVKRDLDNYRAALKEITHLSTVQSLEYKKENHLKSLSDTSAESVPPAEGDPVIKDLNILNADWSGGDLTPETIEVLSEIGISETYMDIEFINRTLQKRITECLSIISKGQGGKKQVLIGNSLVSISSSANTVNEHLANINMPTLKKNDYTMRPTGIGDLLIVKQQLLKYEPGEVAHLENILARETKERTHRKFSSVTSTIYEETEIISENENELESNEKFSLEKETSKVISSDTHFEAGVGLTAGYGTVHFSANVGYATNNAQTEASRNASSYAKDVTKRAVSRLTERVYTERSQTTVNEIEETNLHRIDNAAGTEHVVGVYRWIDKFYKAQTYNYGKRMMFEFMIPEPAAYFIFNKAKNEEITFEKPTKPAEINSMNPNLPNLISFNEIDETNYRFYGTLYGVQDLAPPPPKYNYVAQAFHKDIIEPVSTAMAESKNEIVIPDGYKALSVTTKFIRYDVGLDLYVYVNNSLFALYTNNEGNIINNTNEELQLYGITGIVPVIIKYSGRTYAAKVTVKCERTYETWDKWRIATYNSIMSAYSNKLMAYEEKMSELLIGNNNVKGENPEINRQTERKELKKSALRIFTKQAFEGFGSVINNDNGMPSIDINKAKQDGAYIKFFEQAFEWKQMTYHFYPYFWGAKEKWAEVKALNDTDPLFTNFLQAGAARVVVPAHPAFTDALLHYVATGEIWEGQGAPVLDDKFYMSIANEIRSAQDDTGGTSEGEPWLIKIPTSLVMLITDKALLELPDNQAKLNMNIE